MLPEILLGCCLIAAIVLWLITAYRGRRFKKEAVEWESASSAWKITAEKWRERSKDWETLSKQWQDNYFKSNREYLKAIEIIDQQDKWLKTKIRGM